MPTTYLAPGVYVEEVPSLQQPIAGVGTNTVGFIGLVPDKIQRAVPNEKYDRIAAVAAAAGTDAVKAEIAKITAKVRDLEASQANATTALATATTALAAPELAAGAARGLERERDRRTAELAKIKADLDVAHQELARLNNLQGAADVLRPYTLEDFTVTVDPFDAKLCTNFSEYTKRFGDFSADDPDKEAGTAFSPEHRALTHAVYGFFENGGTKCFVVRVTDDTGDQIDRALAEFESIDAIALVAAPGLNGKEIWGKLTDHCDKLQNRFAILDTPADVETGGDLDVELLDFGNDKNLLPSSNKNSALYFPYIYVQDPAKQLQDEDPKRKTARKDRGWVTVPPSGHVAGIYARTDEQRGVHKAPANETVRGALDVKYYISRPKQELLNPQGVNCIRNMKGNIVVYGARTVGGDKNGEWKYVNVRRVFLYIRESIDEGTQWAVFEPNDEKLWGKLKLNVNAFLTNVWRSGALFGSTPQEAFFIKCDAETNPVEVRDLGQVIIEIGIAIVRPAEFVIFRISQWAGPQTS
jgi:phage tail sheath protein FI